ncbi:hypothetical protein V7x_21450 [Crateriforma conspicua]|uniref:Uncharacterized protein n=1 Tax=Crateriforma conspicua TaxID=2527996 RepID=A0A5C6FYY4_9PLAN|nr:hypothetical protein V7x_21450 [Crateriforma conspicua]
MGVRASDASVASERPTRIDSAIRFRSIDFCIGCCVGLLLCWVAAVLDYRASPATVTLILGDRGAWPSGGRRGCLLVRAIGRPRLRANPAAPVSYTALGPYRQIYAGGLARNQLCRLPIGQNDGGKWHPMPGASGTECQRAVATKRWLSPPRSPVSLLTERPSVHQLNARLALS